MATAVNADSRNQRPHCFAGQSRILDVNAVDPRSVARPARTHVDSPITLSIAEEGRFSRLATAASQRNPELAQRLLGEVERARLLPPEKMPAEVVAMLSHAEYRDAATGATRGVQLVYSNAADIASGRVLVLTLVGAALLGLAGGQSVLWPTQHGRERVLTVLRVSPQPFAMAKA